MLLVLALSTSITSCEEFFAIFDDPVEETDPVTPPEPDPDTPTPPETIMPTDEELKANALRILAEIQKNEALFSIYYTLDGVESVAIFKNENGQYIYQEPATSARRRFTLAEMLVEIEIIRFLASKPYLFLTMARCGTREAIAQLHFDLSSATYSQVTPVLVDGSQVSLAPQGIALMKDGTASGSVPPTISAAAAALEDPNGAVKDVVFASKEELEGFAKGLQSGDRSVWDRVGLVDQVDGDGNLYATSLAIGAADDEGKIHMKVGETKNLDIKLFPTNSTAGMLMYNVYSEGVVTVNDGTLTALSAGQAEVAVSLWGVDESDQKVTVIVEKTPSSISFSDITPSVTWSATAAENSYTQTVSNTGTGSVTYSINADNTCGATIDATGTVTFTKAGTVTVTATAADDNTYAYSTATASYTLTVNPIAAAISFAASVVNKTNTDKAFTNTLTNTGDGKVTYTSSDTSVAEVDADGKVTIMGTGTAIITATVADGDCYTYPTKSVTYTLNISANPSILDKPTGYGHGENPF